ncbi:MULTISPECIES: hypothetical protein [unclassified Mesorhizobium]|uniref:hypothetical protein n=1 Tax=unclassified Mesorhizobium TaxID=325217 RepID=UPI0030146483
MDRMLTSKDLGPHIGGFPIVLGATAQKHRYLGSTGVYTYKFPNLKWGEETHQSIEEVYSGEGHFQMSVLPPDVSDIPVVGICLLQARMGYVYSPIENERAFRVPLADAAEPWEGNEQDMYAVLRRTVADHVASVNGRSVDVDASRLPGG